MVIKIEELEDMYIYEGRKKNDMFGFDTTLFTRTLNAKICGFVLLE